jgi:transcriptional regulator with XRE-family HTH domain
LTNGQQAGAPHAQRVRLGSELRRLRKLAGLSGRDIARRIGSSQAHVSRVENGQAVPTLPQVTAWADVTGAFDDALAALTALTKAALNEVDAWRTRFDAGLPSMQQDVRAMEAAAGVITYFQPSLAPGLLQTAEYARRVFELTDVKGWGDHAAAVAARIERQQALYQPGRRFEFLLTEAALRLRIGPPHVMRGQADRIISVMSLDTVEVGVIPLDADASVIPWVGFNFYDDLPDDQPAFVTVELPHAWLTASDPGDVEIYKQQLTVIRTAALHGPDARRLLEEIGRSAGQ